MTSQINTNGINANYPVPGTNNSSQGFRDNFAQIKGQFNTTANEITDLQSKVVLKAALDNTTLNNDMGNVLISNAATSGFRATTYNLGNALAGTVLVDVSRADVHYGSLTGNVVLQFGNWAPTNTQSNVVVRLTYANAAGSPAYVSLPSSCVNANNNFGVTLLENYSNVGGVATLSAPADANIIELRFSTLDCGNTVTVEPINRPYQATHIVNRNPSPAGLPGDTAGAVAINAIPSVMVANTNGSGNLIILETPTSNLYPDLPIIFSGNTDESNTNIYPGTTYFVSNVANSTAFTVSEILYGLELDIGSTTNSFEAIPASYLCVCTGSYDSTATSKSVLSTNVSGNITLSGTSNMDIGLPIIFTGNVIGGLKANTVYYINSVDTGTSNITVSYSRTNGVPGTQVKLTTATASNCVASWYSDGTDIWQYISTIPGSTGGGTGNGVPGGSNTMVQYNDNGSFGGESTFTYNQATNTLTVANVTVTSKTNLGAVGNVKITGGSSGYVLSTDGVGNLSWIPAGGSGSYGNSNVASFLASYGSNTISTTGNITSGNLNVGKLANLGPVGNVTITGGTNGQFLQTDGAGNLSWVTGSGLGTRVSVSATTTSLPANSSTNLTIANVCNGYALYSIATSANAWVVVYSNAASRTSDSSRTQYTDPTPNSGVLAEAITTTTAPQYYTPGLYCYNNENSPDGNIYLKVLNNTLSTATITVTLTLLELEK